MQLEGVGLALVIGCGLCLLLIAASIVLPILSVVIDAFTTLFELASGLLGGGPIGCIGCLVLMAGCGGALFLIYVITTASSQP